MMRKQAKQIRVGGQERSEAELAREPKLVRGGSEDQRARREEVVEAGRLGWFRAYQVDAREGDVRRRRLEDEACDPCEHVVRDDARIAPAVDDDARGEAVVVQLRR